MDLKELGVNALGHRRTLLDAFAALHADPKAPPLEALPTIDTSAKDTAERCKVTVMFSDLVGSTALSAIMNPKDLREVISAYQNKQAAKELLLYFSQKASVARLVEASFGYDLPAFQSMYDIDTWKIVEPPMGTVYSYPPRGDEQTSIAGAPARTEIGAQI